MRRTLIIFSVALYAMSVVCLFLIMFLMLSRVLNSEVFVGLGVSMVLFACLGTAFVLNVKEEI